MTGRTDEPLVLKVMRLRRPLVEPASIFQNTTLNFEPPAISSVACGLEPCSDAPKLLLPMALTQSFVGEPFSGYLHLSNRSTEPVHDVVLRVEMQVGNSRVCLFDNSARPLGVIEPNDFLDVGVEHELQDAGTYVLTCNVSYAPASGAAKPGLFKRSYRFPALQPFSVGHRVAQLGPRLLVECSVENATSTSLILTSWHLECAGGLEAVVIGSGGSSVSSSSSAPGGSDLAEKRCSPQVLRPRGSQNIVFVVSPSGFADRAGVAEQGVSTETAIAGDSEAVRRLRELDLVGHLVLGWQVPDGPSGRVEGHQVRLTPLSVPGLELRVVSRPQQVHVEVPFQLEAEITNRTAQSVEPSIIFEQRLLGALRVQGLMRQAAGRLEPHAATRINLEFSATAPGLHSLRGLTLVDEPTQQKVEFGALCEVLAF